MQDGSENDVFRSPHIRQCLVDVLEEHFSIWPPGKVMLARPDDSSLVCI